MVHVFLKKIINNTQGIGIGCGIKIECAAQKMPGGVTYKKLFCRGSISANIKKNAMYTQWGADQGIFNGTGFIGVFVCHFISILPEFVKIAVNLFIADIYPGMESREINIDPVWIFRFVSKKCSVPDYITINRIFKGIWKFGPVEGLILMRWKINSEITAGSGRIVAVAGDEEND